MHGGGPGQLLRGRPVNPTSEVRDATTAVAPDGSAPCDDAGSDDGQDAPAHQGAQGDQHRLPHRRRAVLLRGRGSANRLQRGGASSPAWSNSSRSNRFTDRCSDIGGSPRTDHGHERNDSGAHSDELNRLDLSWTPDEPSTEGSSELETAADSGWTLSCCSRLVTTRLQSATL